MSKSKHKRRQFSATFKSRAVRLAQASTRSVSQVARELQISEKTLHNWLRVAKGSADLSSGGSGTPDSGDRTADARITELEAELTRLRQRCAELRLAAVYLAEGES